MSKTQITAGALRKYQQGRRISDRDMDNMVNLLVHADENDVKMFGQQERVIYALLTKTNMIVPNSSNAARDRIARALNAARKKL